MEWSDTGPTGTAPPDPAILPELAATVALLDEMSKEVPVDAPWQAAKALEYDGQTLETWIRDNSATQRYRNLVPLATRPIFGTEPRDLSLLFVLFYIAASGDETHAARSSATSTRATARRCSGSRAARARWSTDGPRAREQAPAATRPFAGSCRPAAACASRPTSSPSGPSASIVAVPPALAGRIDYRPLLPFQRDQLTQRMGQGTLTKVSARYETPFWRDGGYTGTGLSSGGFVSATFDGSPPDGGPGVVFGFVGGDKAREYERLSKGERRARVLPSSPSSGARRPSARRSSGTRAGPRSAGTAADRWGSTGPAAWSRTAPPCAHPWAGSTGPGPRRRPTGTATWTAPSARASGQPRKCSPSCERAGAERDAPRGDRGARRARARRRLARASRWRRTGCAQRFEQLGCDATVDEEVFLDGYAPLQRRFRRSARSPALAALAGPGAAARRAGGAGAAAAIADDCANWSRFARRRSPRAATTWNVVAETGDREAERTLVLMAHHDAAPTGVHLRRTAPAEAERPCAPDVIERDRHRRADVVAGDRGARAVRTRRADGPPRARPCAGSCCRAAPRLVRRHRAHRIVPGPTTT